MHILVISQYFYPEQFRINDIALEWVKKGYKVTVLTGIPNYPQGKFYDGYGWNQKRRESWNGIDIIRIPIVARGKSKIKLALNYFSFMMSGWIWKTFTNVYPDLVFIYEVSPMTQANVGVWIAKKRKIPCYIYVTDLWPENFEIITGIHNRIIIAPIEKMVKKIYNYCEEIFVSSRGFVKSIESRDISKNKIVYWPQYAEDYYIPICTEQIPHNVYSIRDNGRFNILFAGNIGEAQGLKILVNAAVILKQKGIQDVVFTLVGDGRYKDTLIQLVSDNNVDDFFKFYSKVPPTTVPYLIAQATASLICLSKSEIFSITLPAKTQSCLACGKPVIVSADGEIQDVIKEANCGICSAAGDDKQLVKNILYLKTLSSEKLNQMGTSAIEYYNKNFSKSKLLAEMDVYIARSI